MYPGGVHRKDSSYNIILKRYRSNVKIWRDVMTDEEFERLYGRPPMKRNGQKRYKIHWGRIIIALIVLVLIICGVVQLIKSIARKIKGSDPIPVVTNSQAENSAPDSAAESQAAESTAESQAEPPVQQQKQWQFKVCIDPGHGGEDAGAILTDDSGENVLRKEKDDTFRLGFAVRDYLRSQNVQVIMSRETDVMMDLADVCKICNDNWCDLFVSLHRDSVAAHVSGFEACVHSTMPEMDTVLAQNIMNNLKNVGISNDRGIVYGFTNDNTQNYHVNADTACPSVLMEMGFITSPEDNKLFDENFEAYAKAIGDAIIQTAQDLGVVDANGTRLLDKMLISDSKLYYGYDYYFSPGKIPS